MNLGKQESITVILIVLGMMALTGCQTIEKENAMSAEQMLSASGFQMKLAETPEQQANIEAMPQRKLIPHLKDGENVYVYADAEFCHCVYVGAENNYQQYQKMAYEQNLADEQRSTAEMNEDATMNWDLWGPWRPWW